MHSQRQRTALVVLAGLLLSSCSGVGAVTSQPQTTDLPTISVLSAVDADDEPDTATLPAEDETPPTDEETPAANNGAVVTGGWVASGDRVAIYVQWTQDAGGNLTGTYDQTSLADDGTSVKPLHFTITGFVSSGQITLHLARGLMETLTMTGTISDEELDLAFPQADGTIITNRLIPGDTNDYNERVARLRSAASSGAEDAAQSQAAQQSADDQAAQVRQDQSAVDTAARVLASDIYCRFQSAVPNGRSSYPGFFAVLKGLEQNGRFTPADRDLWAGIVARSYALHSEPPASSFEHPGARSWFRSSAVDLQDLAQDACALLDRYDVAWVELRTSRPGRIVYEDELQVVAVGA